MATSASAASSPGNSLYGSALDHGANDNPMDDHVIPDTDTIPVETLVDHLLAAKRSLSSMNLVLRANGFSTLARQLHEEAVISGAQTAFLKKGIRDQMKLLMRVRRSLIRTYDAGKRDFKQIPKTLDAANGKLEATMDMLRNTTVDAAFRPAGEEPKNLLDFVDETKVDRLRDALKASIGELQATQTSFDGDLFRLENDLRLLEKTLTLPASSASPPKSPGASANEPPNQANMLDLLVSLTDRSHSMAQHLTMLTRHFDMCVTAVRITEGGAALARRRAAEDSAEADPVSISGVMAEQERNVEELDPQERAQILQVVMEDAPQVDEVIADLNAEMQEIEVIFGLLKEQAEQVKAAYVAVTQAFQILEEIGNRLPSYIAAESEFIARWEDEKDNIFARLDEMEALRDFYDGYLSAYDSLILEVERRRAVEEKIQGIWRKAKEAVDKLVESDWRDRETFRAEVGEYVPTDLWVGMSGPLKRWEVVRANGSEGSASASREAASEEMPRQEDGSAAILGREVVDAARQRIRMGMSGSGSGRR